MTLEESVWADGRIQVKDMTFGLTSKYREGAGHINSPGTLRNTLCVLTHFILITS